MRALVVPLDDEALTAPVNEFWTVAGVLGHIAYWDIRFQTLAAKIDSGEPWAPGDAEPDGDWLNDSTRPLIHAIAPREAAHLALRTAEETRWPPGCRRIGSGRMIPTARSARRAASTAASTSTRSKQRFARAPSHRLGLTLAASRAQTSR